MIESTQLATFAGESVPIATLSVMDVSTMHITEKDSRVISQHPDLYALEYQEGFWIYVSDEYLDEEFQKQVIANGASEALMNLLCFAAHNGFSWMRIDRDGEDYDFLPKFDW